MKESTAAAGKPTATAEAGRQLQGSVHRHQRHYSSDQLIFDETLPSSAVHVLQQVEAPPRLSSRPTSQRMSRGDFSPEAIPGILDLHSYDTELLSDIRGSGLYDSPSSLGHGNGLEFADSASSLGFMPENDLRKSFDVDKEKLSSVAKIKVVVRKRPLNKKERVKGEEDIITIEQSTSSFMRPNSRVKSLSKGGNLKKEISAPSNLRESTTAAIYSISPNIFPPENRGIEYILLRHSIGWTKQISKVPPSHCG